MPWSLIARIFRINSLHALPWLASALSRRATRPHQPRHAAGEAGGAEEGSWSSVGAIKVQVPEEGQQPTLQNFSYELDKETYRQTLEQDGSYILRSNAIQEDASTMWSMNMQLVRSSRRSSRSRAIWRSARCGTRTSRVGRGASPCGVHGLLPARDAGQISAVGGTGPEPTGRAGANCRPFGC